VVVEGLARDAGVRQHPLHGQGACSIRDGHLHDRVHDPPALVLGDILRRQAVAPARQLPLRHQPARRNGSTA
jgi:hypothetical protein